MMPPLLANSLWWAAAQGEAVRFTRALDAVEATQRAVLARILRGNAGTRYGRRHGFAQIRNSDDYRRQAPLTDYESLRPEMEACLRGEADVLFPGIAHSFTPTSGSTAAGKLIPSTPALRAEYQAGIGAWIVDLFRHYPALRGGRAYWSISPAANREHRSPAGIPIGFDDDTAYLHPVIARILSATLAAPAALARVPDLDVFRYLTLAFLLAARDLALISVWNPTFLSLLLAPLPGWAARLADDLDAGTLSPPGEIPDATRPFLTRAWRPQPRRAAEVRHLLATAPPAGSLHRALWPGLALISCWADAAASRAADDLQPLFPGVPIAPKGLLATEGIVSLPLYGHPGAALALRSHFLEFLPIGETEETRLAWELQEGECYSVVLTTGGGLYRYRLGDRIRVVGFARQCPLVKFLGRDGAVSDLCGEKLHEAHVAAALARLFTECGWSPAFALLAPDDRGDTPRYALLLAGDGAPMPLPALADRLDVLLRDNFHYDYCRALGQLDGIRACWLGDARRVRAAWQATCQARGQRLGDIKEPSLDRSSGWPSILASDDT